MTDKKPLKQKRREAILKFKNEANSSKREELLNLTLDMLNEGQRKELIEYLELEV